MFLEILISVWESYKIPKCDLKMCIETIIILTHNLGTKTVLVWLVPHNLNFLQKHTRNDIAQVMMEWANMDKTFIKRIITVAKTSVHEFDVLNVELPLSGRCFESRKYKKPKSKKELRDIPKRVF